MNAALHAPHTPWGRTIGLGVVLSFVVCIVVLAFSWPSVTLDPKNVPIGISGPAQAVQPVEQALNEAGDGVFDLQEFDDRDAAVQAIKTRDIYGAVVLGTTPEVLTSSAASTATNQLMTQLHTQVQAMAQQQADAAAQAAGAAAPTVTVKLTDVVPLSDNDPRGAGLAAAALPLVFGGMIGGVAIAFTVSGVWRRVVALITYAIVGGLAITGIMQGWFGVLEGDYLLNVSAFSLTLLAMGATIVGFASVFGRPGIAVGPVLFMLIGNPISGATFPKEFYPAPWGEIGQFFPPGAGATLIRNLSYFPDADSTFPIVVLACWAVGGLILTGLGHFRNEASVGEPETAPEAVTA